MFGGFKITNLSQEIKPFETKAIARANFYGRATSNHTSYIRIRTDAMEGGVSLVLPVEVEVSDPSGLFLSRELLDFGILKSGGEKVVEVVWFGGSDKARRPLWDMVWWVRREGGCGVWWVRREGVWLGG